jgi:high affinity Mn2+ porin
LDVVGRIASALVAGVLSSNLAHAAADDEAYAVHGQFTYVGQATSDFNSPYEGANSLSPKISAETVDATLYLGAALWRGAQGWINAELDQGFGLDDTLGVAGFPSGEAYKVGKDHPYLRLPRMFVRQCFDLDGEPQPVESGANQLAGTQSANRIVLWLGKFSAVDIFDTNEYAHDARADFLNWSVIDTGTFDYAADAWGYTVGAAAEWYQGAWTLRAGFFDMSDVPNSVHLQPGFHEYQIDAELEHRHEFRGRAGRLLFTLFDSHANMGLLDEAVELAQSSGTPVDIAAVRRYRNRNGASFSAQQEIAADLGAFLRAGVADGDIEIYEFTEIDRTVSAGLSLKGSRWRRSDDTVGAGVVDNGISAARERYLNAGGLGIVIGDGRLPHPGPEQIVETYYCAALWKFAHLTFDYQWIGHPAYNRDRGPVSVVAVRLHAEF